jgi:type 1 fimbria pilin
MKLFLAFISILLNSVFFSAYAELTTLKFTGTVKAGTCEVSTESKDQNIIIGKINSTAFRGVGSTAGHTPFFINLINCVNVNSIEVSMIGDASSDNGDYFALDNNADKARGIALRISNKQGTLQKPSGEVVSYPGNNIEKQSLEFFVDYVQTLPTVTTGRANGSANFVINYK